MTRSNFGKAGVLLNATFLLLATFMPAASVSGQDSRVETRQGHAQPGPETSRQSDDDPEIVVTATTVREQLRLAAEYVRGLTVAVPSDPLARYNADVYCPAVVGLSPARNGEIAARMRAVAAAAGVRPAGPDCRTSALVIFVDDKESFLASFRREHPVYFTDLRRTYGRFPPREEGPATAWHLVAQIDPQGAPLGRRTNLGPVVVESPMRGSRILSMITQSVAMSVVVIERRALIGLTPTQIADYSLMRTLTDHGQQRLNVPGEFTILRALTTPMGDAVPQTLTEWDLAYLEARYSGHPALYGERQRAIIQRDVRRAVRRDAGD